MNVATKSVLLACVVVLGACQTRELNTKTSFQTGWNTFDKTTTRFEVYDGSVSQEPIGMLPIKGGSFTIGQMSEFVTASHNSGLRTVTVGSFYMDKYEVTNMAWREYVDWMSYVFGRYNLAIVESALPDTSVWRDELAYNEPYVENYFRHPAYSFYPVVGVSWDQAMSYCQWRTDRVNEKLLASGGYMEWAPYEMLNSNTYMTEEAIDKFLLHNPQHPEYSNYEKVAVEVPLSIAVKYGYVSEETSNKEEIAQTEEPMVTMYQLPYEWVRDQFVFNTEKYFYSSTYRPSFGKGARKDASDNLRKLNKADGILLLGYRLPTEAEWEYAAFAPVADNENGIPTEGRIYPWSGYYPRDISKENRGKMMANFIRSKGDMMGVAGAVNDGYVYTAPVDAYAPNDFGLYNMAGNVNEWVLDVYRETSFEEMTEYNPYRGNIYSRIKRDSLNNLVINAVGCLDIEYAAADDKRNFRDGDAISRFNTDYPLDTTGLSAEQLADVKYDPTDVLVPRINSRSRVYKGGSWNDRIYWLNPTTRRFLDQSQSSSTIGFRCAMSMLGEE